MKLTIEVVFENSNGLDMEIKLNKAIADFSEVLLKRGCSIMELEGQEMVDGDIETFYTVKIE